MIVAVLRTIARTIGAIVIGVGAGAAVFFLVFSMPVLLGQPKESMAGRGWVTFVPAFALGVSVGLALLLYLMRKGIAAEANAFANARNLQVAVVVSVVVVLYLLGDLVLSGILR